MKKHLVRLVVMALVLSLGLSALASAQQVLPNALKISKTSITINYKAGAANSVQLSAATTPPLGTLTEKLVWTSDDPQIATVSENGLVKAVSGGVTRVRASIQGVSKMLSVACKVTVKTVAVKKVSLSENQLILAAPSSSSGETHQLKATVSPGKASFPQVEWSSSNPSVAKVSKNGLVTAVGDGQCVITAAADRGKVKATCPVVVRDESKPREITISAGGDIVLGGDKDKKTDVRFAAFYDQYGPDYVLKNLKKVFQRDDVTVLNLEGPLKGGRERRPERQYNFYGKPEYVNILTAGSVEVANIANNHIDDFGTKGATIKILEDAGVIVSNTGFEPTENMMTIDGVRVGFMGFMVPTSMGTIKSRVSRAKKKCDVLIVSLHFGNVPERTHKVTSSQRSYARGTIDAGADMILGHHTHVTSGIETYKGKYIYYGLGAVESSGKEFRYNNFITQQTLRVNLASGTVESLIPTIYPICASGAPATEENNCQPILLTPSDPGYHEVFETIDRESSRGALNPAPYIKG